MWCQKKKKKKRGSYIVIAGIPVHIKMNIEILIYIKKNKLNFICRFFFSSLLFMGNKQQQKKMNTGNLCIFLKQKTQMIFSIAAAAAKRDSLGK